MTANNPPPLPGIVLRSIAGGMILMALFTAAWINVAAIGLRPNDLIWQLIAGAFGLWLIVTAVYFFRASRHFPRLRSDEDKAEGKKIGMWYGIIFGGEGLVIGGTCATLGVTGHSAYILPATALIVGLHFYPMAKLFNRTIDYYVATWTVCVAIAALYMVSKGAGEGRVFILTGFGMAMATAAYGLYMTAAGRKIVRSRVAVTGPGGV
jgi:uncharacterized membrane protein (DUF485 family)